METKNGHANVWHDNWTQLGNLHYLFPIAESDANIIEDVRQLFVEGMRNARLLELLSIEEVCNHVQKYLIVEINLGNWHKPWWMPNSFRKIYSKIWLGSCHDLRLFPSRNTVLRAINDPNLNHGLICIIILNKIAIYWVEAN